MDNKNNQLSETIISQADIVSVIGSFIKISKKGANYVALCPFHPDSNPSLSISPTKKIWKCFVCGASGNVINFVQQFKKVSYIEAVKIIADLCKIDISKFSYQFTNSILDPKIKVFYDLNTHVNNYYEGFLYNDENKSRLEYLHRRGLDDTIIKHFHLGYAPAQAKFIYEICVNKDNMFGDDYDKNLIWNEQQLIENSIISINEKNEIYDFLIDRITFPIIDKNGYILAFSGRTTVDRSPKYLNSKETKIFNKGSCFYNINNFATENSSQLILVEGYMDVIAYYRAGIKNVMGLMGVNMSSSHINILKKMNNIKTIVLSFDNDDAGTNANINIGKLLVQNDWNVSVVGTYDAAIKDVDELCNKKGASAIKQIVEERVDFFSFLISKTFKEKMPVDQKLDLLNTLLEFIAKYPKNLLKSTHFEKIATASGFNVSDINDKYEFFSKKNIRGEVINAFRPVMSTFVPSTNLVSHKKDPLQGIKINLNEIIRICLHMNKFIPLTMNKISKNVFFDDELNDVTVLLKLMFKIYEENNAKVTYDDIVDAFNDKYSDMQDAKLFFESNTGLKVPFVNQPEAKFTKTILDLIETVNIAYKKMITESISNQINVEKIKVPRDENKINHLLAQLKEASK